MLGPFHYERGITTHPAVVSAVAAVLERRGARVMVGDNPGMHAYGENLLCAKKCGIYDACKRWYVNLGEKPISVPADSAFADRFLISKQITEVDMIVSVPKFKTHVITTITGAIKNSFGFLVGGQKSELHRTVPDYDDFNEVVVDVYRTRVPDFFIMDAVVGMEGIGPSSKDLRDIGKIIAGDNGVAVDAAMAIMMGLQPEQVKLLRIAEERGLGNASRERLDVNGVLAPIPDFKLPSPWLRGNLSAFLARVFTSIVVRKPVVNKSLCKRCGLCAKQCPMDAIKLEPYPVIDEANCISCFCCYEYCEENAIQLRRSVRLFRRWFS